MKGKSYRNKVVIITGSSKGIGRTTAMAFLKKGARVVINGRTKSKLMATKELFRRKGYDVLAVSGDVTDYAFCKQLIDKTKKEYGKVDYLINNAGLPMRGRFEDITPEVILQVTNSNLLSSLYCTKAALDELKQTKGSIIFISSIAGIRGVPHASIYSAAKMGLTGLAESLRIELHKSRVHVGALYVGLTKNDSDKEIIGKDGNSIQVKGGSHHQQEDVARAIMKMIENRTAYKTLTYLGKFTRAMNWLFPGIVHEILVKTQNSSKYN